MPSLLLEIQLRLYTEGHITLASRWTVLQHRLVSMALAAKAVDYSHRTSQIGVAKTTEIIFRRSRSCSYLTSHARPMYVYDRFHSCVRPGIYEYNILRSTHHGWLHNTIPETRNQKKQPYRTKRNIAPTLPWLPRCHGNRIKPTSIEAIRHQAPGG